VKYLDTKEVSKISGTFFLEIRNYWIDSKIVNMQVL